MTLTADQIVWAKAHGWFHKDNGDGTITVIDAYVIDGQLHEDAILWTGNFSALRDWAGY